MIDLSRLLELLSDNKIKYNKNNIKLKVKKDGKWETGRDKLLITISNLSGKEIYQSHGCETENKKLMIDERALYNVEYTIEE